MIVDWLSVTFELGEGETLYQLTELTRLALYRSFGQQLGDAIWLDTVPTSPRNPYVAAWKQPDRNIVTFANTVGQGLVEVSGQGCATLRQMSLLEAMLHLAETVCTRVDIAIDILGLTPDEIVSKGYSARFRSHTRIASDKGITHYIGSVKSERYARVYRYAPPNPRAHLCRIELVHRKGYAKLAVKAINRDGIVKTALSALASYKFQHEGVPTSEQPLATVAILKSSQKTVTWLIAQCAPAFKRLVSEGVIEDPGAFLQKHFLSGNPPSL